jgi:MbtH protein
VPTDELSTASRYKVVVNDEGQYSIWPEERETPRGWMEDGISGSQEDCLAHIAEVWTDLRPVSVRAALSQPDEASSSSQNVL